MAALNLKSDDARALAEQYSWHNSASQFLHNLAPFSGGFDGVEATRISVEDAASIPNAQKADNGHQTSDGDEITGTSPVGQPAQ